MRERWKQWGGMAFLTWLSVNGGFVCGTRWRVFFFSPFFLGEDIRPPAPILLQGLCAILKKGQYVKVGRHPNQNFQ